MSESASPQKFSFDKLVPILLLVSLGLTISVGILWQKVAKIEKGNVAGTATGEGTQAGNEVSLNQIKDLFKKDLIKFGDEKSNLIFVEISDPSCPYCNIVAGLNPELNREADPTNNKFKLVSDGGTYQAPVPEIEKLVASGKASFIYIYAPGHGNGEMGTKALYCAFEKGKFWEVYNLLMTKEGYDLLNNTIKNDKTKSENLANFLKSTIDSAFLKECLDGGKYDSRLNNDKDIATSLGFQGTPDFFINDKNFPGAYNWTDMKLIVDEALK